MTELEGEEAASLLPKLPARVRNCTAKPLALGGKEERWLSTLCGHGEGTQANPSKLRWVTPLDGGSSTSLCVWTMRPQGLARSTRNGVARPEREHRRRLAGASTVEGHHHRPYDRGHWPRRSGIDTCL